MTHSYGENFTSAMMSRIDGMLDKYSDKDVQQTVEDRDRITPPALTKETLGNYAEHKDLPRQVRRIISAVAKETKLHPRQLLYHRYNGRTAEEKRGHSLLIYFLRYDMEATFSQISDWVGQEPGHLSKTVRSIRKGRQEDLDLDKLITRVSLCLCNRG